MIASKAVFLSYAHEDAAAASQVAEAFRAAGVEVWFDQNELRGGDVWDRKIRKQIKECALFVPVISQNTQARKEGYFRLEWRLADQRTHLMGKTAAFVVPLSIDATKDDEADVPDSFLEVQWTRLTKRSAEGVYDALELSDFAQHVKNLIACGDLQFTPAPFGMTAAAQPGATPPSGSVIAPVRMSAPQLGPVAAPEKLGRGIPVAALVAGAVVIAAVMVYFVFARKSPTAGAGTRPPTVEKTAPPKVDAKSIAVLPFVNQSDDKDGNAIFADGIHDDILTNLANIAELKVISRTSVMQYRDTKLPLRKIAQDLGVAYVLEGSVRRAGGQVRVTGQLIRAATDEHVWAKNYTEELTANNLFAIQTALATEIAGALRSVLSPQEKKLIARVPTASLDAYDLYLKARDLRNRQGTSSPMVREQTRLLERAIAIDPQFGLAWAQLGWARSLLFSTSGGDGQRNAMHAAGAREAVEKAKGIIPDSPEFFLSRGWLHYFVEKDYGLAFGEFRRAVELSPSFAEARYAMAMVHRRQGHWRETLKTLHEVERIDPANPEYAQEIAVTALSGRRYADAEVALRRAVVLGRTVGVVPRLRVLLPFMSSGELPSDALLAELPSKYDREELSLLREKPMPSTEAVSVNLAIVDALKLAANGEKAAVRSRLEQPVGNVRKFVESESTNADLWSQLGLMEALLGNREEALRCVAKALALNPESKDAWFGPSYRIVVAHVYAWTGDTESALREYDRLLQTTFSRAFGSWVMNVFVMRRHPAFAPLRGDPRFEALLNDPKNNAPLF